MNRPRVIQALLAWETSHDPDIIKDAMRDMLLVGCKGYQDMTDEELAFEVNDAWENLWKDPELRDDMPEELIEAKAAVEEVV